MKNLYSIYDRATESYTPPFQQPSNNAAIRAIKNEIRQPDSQLAQHPTDYELYQVGTFDETTGNITAVKERIARIEDITGN